MNQKRYWLRGAIVYYLIIEFLLAIVLIGVSLKVFVPVLSVFQKGIIFFGALITGNYPSDGFLFKFFLLSIPVNLIGSAPIGALLGFLYGKIKNRGQIS